ncbi:MAG: 3-isopropylmalate dehydrogenase [Gemmatimonadetes bacterium]|nr:3-isopropylmalate dehydrogenase [Gemmatimonadota bacterium]
MAQLHVVSLPGDGIGPEVTRAAMQVLETVASRFGHELSVEEHQAGWCAYESTGTPLPDSTLAACVRGPAVFLGAVGDPRADGLPPGKRPEAALLKLRSTLGCFANLRPARVDEELVDMSALKREIAAGCDMVIVRELTGGLYYGQPRSRDADRAVNTLVYTKAEVERVAKVAFDLAHGRRRHVTSVDKANVLEVSQLWRAVVEEVAKGYPDVKLDHMFVDRAAMELVTAPKQFDVILTENLFGDILSDEASAMCGSLGLLASASVGGKVGLYEPVHGSAPDIAGKGIANPIAAIRSAALMLSYSFSLHAEAAAVERAVSKALADGLRTADLVPRGMASVSTTTFANAVAEAVK